MLGEHACGLCMCVHLGRWGVLVSVDMGMEARGCWRKDFPLKGHAPVQVYWLLSEPTIYLPVSFLPTCRGDNQWPSHHTWLLCGSWRPRHVCTVGTSSTEPPPWPHSQYSKNVNHYVFGRRACDSMHVEVRRQFVEKSVQISPSTRWGPRS